MYRKGGYIVGRIAGLLAVLLMSFLVAVQTPYVQTRLSKLALNQLAAIMDGRVQYDELKVMTSGVLVIRNLKLVDSSPYTEDVNQRGWAPADTVFLAKSITATFTLAGLFSKEGLHMGRVTVEDGYFHLTSEPNEWTSNLARIFHLKPTGEPMTHDNIFDIKKFRIKNFRFRLNSFLPDQDLYKGFGINFEDLDITADISGHGLRLADARMSGTIDKLSAREKSGYIVNQLSGSARVGEGEALIEDLSIDDPWSRVSLRTFIMRYANALAFAHFVEEVSLEAELLRSQLGLQTLAWFAGGTFNGSTAVLDIRRGRMKGPVSDFQVDRLIFNELRSGVGATIEGHVAGIPDIPAMTLDARVRDLSGTTADFSRLLAAILPQGAPDVSHYAPGVPLTLQLSAAGPISDLELEALMQSSDGDLTLTGRLRHLMQTGHSLEASLNLGARELDLGHILGVDALGPVTLHTRANARIAGKGLPDAGLDSLHIERIHALGRDFHDISATGTLQNGTAAGHLQSQDPDARFDLQGLADLTPREGKSQYRLSGQVANLTLAALGIQDAPVSQVSGGIRANLTRTGDFFDGRAALTQLQLTNANGPHPVGDIRLEASTPDGEQLITLKAPFADAAFRGDSPVTRFADDIQDITLRRDLSALYPDPQEPGESGNYTLEAEFHDTRQLLQEFLTGLYIADGTALSLLVRDGILDGRIRSERIAYNTQYLRDFIINLDNRQEALSAQILSSELRAGSLAMLNPAITARADDNALSLDVQYDSFGSKAGEAAVRLEGALSRDEDGILDLRARPHDSYLMAADDRWAIDGSDLILHGNELHLDWLKISNGPQSLLVDGGFSKSRDDTLSLLMDRFDLALVDEFLPERIGVEGKMNGSASLMSGTEGLSGMLMDFRIDTLRVGGTDAGSVLIGSQLNDEDDEIRLRISNELDGREPLLAQGSYFVRDKRLDASATLTDFSLGIASSFLTDILSELDGRLDGTLRLSGPLDALDPYSEDLRLSDARVRVVPTGVAYALSGPIRLNAQGAFLDGLMIQDEEEGRCSVNAGIHFRHFKDFRLDGRVDFNDFKLLDTPERPGFPVYGLLRASGTASAKGPFASLAVDADVSTSGDGQVHIPLSGGLSGASTSSLLTFTEPTRKLDPYEQMIASRTSQSVSSADISIRGHLNVQPSVRTFIEIDKSAGNVAAVSGQGSVNLNLRPSKAVFDLNGDYNISEGNYQFVLPGILSKTFSVERGSSVKFGGDIMNTELDVTATYGLRTSLDPILTSGSNTRRQVNCLIHVSDRLRAPKVNLDIEVPDLDPTSRTEVESAFNTDDKIQKQFVSLLLLGSFLPNEFSSATLTQGNLLLSNLTEMMSGQLNNILQRLEIPIDVGFGYQELSSGQNLFDISLSTQLFENRVLLSGNFGNRRYSTGSTGGDFTGNMDLQVKLDPEGKFRFIVFSHAADEFTSYLDYSQRNGIGVSYQKEYRTFQEFVNHLTMTPKKRQPYDILEAEKQLRQVMIKIENESRETLSDTDSARRERPGRGASAARP